ncbi:hypothetical protein BS47DRAFT_227668 [Hydnum rufescens UP504]|uniref:Uncharacterized protein n=1 Tax=Hydnum rufescens UP504 TaxID=1448309 RepID=A0A9P6DXN7_9AGAM|nr:hypothetical protein BS47DRAFT_227668 [Hydnum rufescens UP504]
MLPGHTRGNKRLRSAWVLGHIQFLRNQQQPLGLTVKRWYCIKNNTEMIVELLPIPGSRAGRQRLSVKQLESETPATASVASTSGAPNEALTREPETSRYSPSCYVQEDADVVPCFPTPQPSPTSPHIKQEIISDVILSNNPKSTDSGTSGATDAVDSLPTQNKPQAKTQRPTVKNISPTNGGGGNHFPPRALPPSLDLRQNVSTSSISRIDSAVEEDVGNIMRIVTPTSHQLIALSDGVAGPTLISKTYVMNISKGGMVEFVVRSPPR